jgi:PHP family Zn ribbon phosphoesterase
MDFISDLHLHSKYSRAVSPSMNLNTMALFAREKGLNLLSISDFTHPVWLKEVKAQVKETSEGIYQLASDTKENTPIYFLFSTEIASIYKQGNKLRRIHNLIFAPDFSIAEKINKSLSQRGINLMADGRPILGISTRNLCELLFEISPRIAVIPCHIWTPWFSLYGSRSGYDHIAECFGEYAFCL